MSLVASTGGITLIPLYAQNMLTPTSSRSSLYAIHVGDHPAPVTSYFPLAQFSVVHTVTSWM